MKVSQLCLTHCDPWNSPGQNTRVDSLSLLQGNFPTQGLNSGLLHCRQILYHLSHKGSHGFHLKILDYLKSILIFSTNFMCSNIITNYLYWSKEKTILKKYSSYSGAIRTLLKHITLNGLPHKERRKKKKN